MEHRHLLPSEIDLLLDGEVGFGTTPLKAHVRRCAECRNELEDARVLVRALEHLPHLAPSPLFTSRVLDHVQIFVPWHVAALDSIRGMLPHSRRGKIFVGAVAGSLAVALTIVSLWMIVRLETVIFAAGVVVERVRSSVWATVGNVLAGMVGESALALLRSNGALLLAATALVILAATLVAARTLRALSLPSRQR